ncbi:unnamed protein product [Caenorhabditis brenneri]
MDSGDHLGNLFSDDDQENDSFDDPLPSATNLVEALAAIDVVDSEVGQYGRQDEEDSFDAQVPCTKNLEERKQSSEFEDEDEEEDVVQCELDLKEEDFNVLTIEKVSLETLTARIKRVITEVLYRGEIAAKALFDVANKIIFQSTMFDVKKNPVIDTIIYGLTMIILESRERDQGAEQAEHFILLFIARLAIKNKSIKCGDLLYQLILLVDRLYLHSDSSVRSFIQRIIGCLMEEANRYADLMREHGDNVFLFTDEDLPEEEEFMIPSGVKNRWMTKVAKSLLDKSPQVRSKAVIALSSWDHDAICKTTNSGEISVNDLLWKSVHDVDETVRVSAARRIHITDEKDIDKCINFIQVSKDNKVRHAIIVRLASDVHLFSFTEKQRFSLIKLLNDSDSARVQDVIHQRLVGSWMKVAGEEISCPTIFTAPESGHKIPNEFPSIIIEYLDPLTDPISAYVFMKFATSRFIRQIAGNNDVEQFMKTLLEMTPKDSECVGLMRRTTFRLVTLDADSEAELKKTFLRILITRSFIDVVFDVAKGSLNANYLRNRALMFFLPDVTYFVEYLKQFCSVYFKMNHTAQHDFKDLLLYNIIHLINISVRYGGIIDDNDTFKLTLMQLLEDPTLDFSTESLAILVMSCLDSCNSAQEREEFCDWICATSNNLMIHGSKEENEEFPNLKKAIEEKSVLDRMLLQSATMLLSTCQHEEIKKPTAAMTDLFKTIIPPLLASETKLIQKVGLELIGYTSSIDFENCKPYLALTRFLIERDDEVLKSTGVNTLIRVIKTHGFPNTAKAIYGKDHETDQVCQNLLAKLFEKSIVSLQGAALVQTVNDCLRMLSQGSYAWPKLLTTILLVTFQKSNEQFPLVKMLRSYCKKINGDFHKMNVLLGFVKAIDVISKSNEQDSSWNVLEMTELVCDCVSSVQTISDDGEGAPKKILEKSVFLEIVLANRMINRAVSRPSASFVRHAFTSMATSLRLECIPLEHLDSLHNSLVDSYTVIRFNSGKTTQIAFKRFMAHCEKVISLHESMRGLKISVDKVKKEIPDPDEISVMSTPSSSGRKKKAPRKDYWDNDEIEEKYDPDDSFEYFPRSTRTRKRASTSSQGTPKKLVKTVSGEEGGDVPEEEFNIEDSPEL